jgi:outer membrane protein assembly factor BamB
MVIHLNMRKGLICLSIVAILMFCLPNVATASMGNYSTTFYNNARHTNGYIPVARSSTLNGILNWNYTTEHILTSSATPSGVVYVGSNYNVYALNADIGAKVWSYKTGSCVMSSPTIANGIVYVGSWDQNVYALNAATGKLVWSYATESGVDSSPAIANGIV